MHFFLKDVQQIRSFVDLHSEIQVQQKKIVILPYIWIIEEKKHFYTIYSKENRIFFRII